MDRCLFCLREDRPMTREHIFAHWLIQQVHAARLVASFPTEAKTPARIARLVATVCADCNAGWMSGLEVSFRRLMFGRPRVGALQAADRVMLSRWFTKTAVLLAHAHGGALLDDLRTSQLCTGTPDEVEVFIARHRRPPQHIDYAVDIDKGSEATLRSVAVLVDGVVAHVARRGALTSDQGTRLWPLRTHALRWETLPVIKPRIGHG